jgi:hypothetical protein
MSEGPDRLEEATALAKAKGRVVVVPKANELFVDIDSEADMERFQRIRVTLESFLSLKVDIRPSPSGRPDRHHIVVTLDREVTEIERVALQAILGSDPTREALSYRRILKGIAPATLFFENP